MQAHAMKPTIKAVPKTGGRSPKPGKSGVKAVTSRRSLTCSDSVWVMPGIMPGTMSVFMVSSSSWWLKSVSCLGRVDGAAGFGRQPDDKGGYGKGDRDH